MSDFRLNRQDLSDKLSKLNENRQVSIKVGDINSRTHLVSSDQDIFDIAIMRTGTVEAIFDEIMEFNNNLNINTVLQPGDKLFVNTNNTSNFNVKNTLKRLNFVVINGGEESDAELPGDYNSDYNNDYFN